MSDLDFDAFSKKYSLGIDGIKNRITDSKKREMVAKTLYNDFINNKINMNELNHSVELFYQGNVFGQVSLNKYIEKYR